jgi:hypothetical protein
MTNAFIECLSLDVAAARLQPGTPRRRCERYRATIRPSSPTPPGCFWGQSVIIGPAVCGRDIEEAQMSIEVESPRSTGPELIWVGDGAWVAHDPSLPEGDPRRVIAYMEHKDRRVYVLWVRDRQDVCCYETLREALDDVTAACRRMARTREAPLPGTSR